VAYATWADINVFLDQAPGLTDRGKLENDPATLQGFLGVIEPLFENNVRGFVSVPISATASPDTFAVAKAICAMRGAVMALEVMRQTQASDVQMWYPQWLEKKSDELVEQLRRDAAKPPDAQAAVNPVVVVPLFVGLPPEPIFRLRPRRRECNDGRGGW
jgi:hypothetical protein